MDALTTTLTCPHCGYQAVERIPLDRCQYFYDCRGCGVVLRPKPGDCCVFCSYADRRCPMHQERPSL
ncbi:MAG TPA: GDCCVxC domain-containing (seleno)protein [Vicinamibacterales bacterium]